MELELYQPGIWTEFGSFIPDTTEMNMNPNSFVTSIEYDKYFDIIWVATSNGNPKNKNFHKGRITSYGFTSNNDQEYIDENNVIPIMYRYSSFSTPKLDIIQQILPNNNAVISISQTLIEISTYGGTSLGSITIPCNQNTMDNSDSKGAEFTCGDLLYEPSTSRTCSSFTSTHILAGTSDNAVHLFDIVHSFGSVVNYDVKSPSVKVQSNGYLTCVAGQDGFIRFLDGKFRSMEVINKIEAHSGSIKDMCMKSDGRTIITCGTIKKPINPYDKNSPCHYSNDLHIKAFDVRMQRQLLPLPIVIPSNRGASFLKFIPQIMSEGSILEYTGVMTCSDDGIIQVNKLTNESLEFVSNAHDTQQALYAPLSIANETVQAVAVSTSGQFMAVGTSIGTIGQYVRASDTFLYDVQHNTSETKATELFKINERSPFPKLVPQKDASMPPLLSLSVDSSSLGTSYVLNTASLTTTEPTILSSSFATTPAVSKRKLKFSSTRKINPELLNKISKQDFIGIIPNTNNFKPNSMIAVATRASTLKGGLADIKSSPYAICDPRRLELLETKHNINEVDDKYTLAYEKNYSYCDSKNLKLYIKPNSYNATKQRFKKFDYSLLNDTNLIGLENNVPNSFLNPLLQLFYWIHPLRTHALLSQLHPYHHEQGNKGGNQSTLLCEMGFLFHMIASIEKYSNPSSAVVDKVVRAANFQRIFQSLQLDPEAAVLGLFDENVRQDLQQFIQSCNHFLLRLLSKEIDKEMKCSEFDNDSGFKGSKCRFNIDNNLRAAMKTNTVDDVFGFSTKSATTFLHSGVHKVDPDCTRYLVLDLIYPSLSTLNGGPATSSNSSTMNSLTSNLSQLSPPTSIKLSNQVNNNQNYIVVGRKGRKILSFASALWSSFRKEITMKGWCKESEAFEPFKKVQTIVSLPKMLLIQCGNTQIDIKDSTTLGGAIGEVQGHGSLHTNFWGYPLEITSTGIIAAEDMREANAVETKLSYRWLPVELEIAFIKVSNNVNDMTMRSDKNALDLKRKLIISCKCMSVPSNIVSNMSSTEKDDCKEEDLIEVIDNDDDDDAPSTTIWIIYDGLQEIVSDQPASLRSDFDILSSSNADDWQICKFILKAVVAQVSFCSSIAPSDEVTHQKQHLVLHINKPQVNYNDSDNQDYDEWYHLNDFVAKKIKAKEVLAFPKWKHPVIIAFEQLNDTSKTVIETSSFTTKVKETIIVNKFERMNKMIEIPLIVPDSVLQLESLSHTPSIRLLQSFAHIPGPGDLIAFDGEFVSTALEKSYINSSGERMVNEETRQVLARISLLDIGKSSKEFEEMQSQTTNINSSLVGNSLSSTFNKQMMRIVADDYILSVEPVVDYVTRFSGITAEDLDPLLSRHSVITQRSAYLKLRYFIDRKCIFVGHGLQKDFETANIFVPPEQIRDTVELWRLPNQRKISLRFLASYILKEDIQDEIHDSIEDAKTALLLYHHYKELEALGMEKVTEVLLKLYQYGNKNNWTIGGMDRFK